MSAQNVALFLLQLYNIIFPPFTIQGYATTGRSRKPTRLIDGLRRSKSFHSSANEDGRPDPPGEENSRNVNKNENNFRGSVAKYVQELERGIKCTVTNMMPKKVTTNLSHLESFDIPTSSSSQSTGKDLRYSHSFKYPSQHEDFHETRSPPSITHSQSFKYTPTSRDTGHGSGDRYRPYAPPKRTPSMHEYNSSNNNQNMIRDKYQSQRNELEIQEIRGRTHKQRYSKDQLTLDLNNSPKRSSSPRKSITNEIINSESLQLLRKYSQESPTWCGVDSLAKRRWDRHGNTQDEPVALTSRRHSSEEILNSSSPISPHRHSCYELSSNRVPPTLSSPSRNFMRPLSDATIGELSNVEHDRLKNPERLAPDGDDYKLVFISSDSSKGSELNTSLESDMVPCSSRVTKSNSFQCKPRRNLQVHASVNTDIGLFNHDDSHSDQEQKSYSNNNVRDRNSRFANKDDISSRQRSKSQQNRYDPNTPPPRPPKPSHLTTTSAEGSSTFFPTLGAIHPSQLHAMLQQTEVVQAEAQALQAALMGAFTPPERPKSSASERPKSSCADWSLSCDRPKSSASADVYNSSGKYSKSNASTVSVESGNHVIFRNRNIPIFQNDEIQQTTKTKKNIGTAQITEDRKKSRDIIVSIQNKPLSSGDVHHRPSSPVKQNLFPSSVVSSRNYFPQFGKGDIEVDKRKTDSIPIRRHSLKTVAATSPYSDKNISNVEFSTTIEESLDNSKINSDSLISSLDKPKSDKVMMSPISRSSEKSVIKGSELGRSFSDVAESRRYSRGVNYEKNKGERVIESKICDSRISRYKTANKTYDNCGTNSNGIELDSSFDKNGLDKTSKYFSNNVQSKSLVDEEEQNNSKSYRRNSDGNGNLKEFTRFGNNNSTESATLLCDTSSPKRNKSFYSKTSNDLDIAIPRKSSISSLGNRRPKSLHESSISDLYQLTSDNSPGLSPTPNTVSRDSSDRKYFIDYSENNDTSIDKGNYKYLNAEKISLSESIGLQSMRHSSGTMQNAHQFQNISSDKCEKISGEMDIIKLSEEAQRSSNYENVMETIKKRKSSKERQEELTSSKCTDAINIKNIDKSDQYSKCRTDVVDVKATCSNSNTSRLPSKAHVTGKETDIYSQNEGDDIGPVAAGTVLQPLGLHSSSNPVKCSGLQPPPTHLPNDPSPLHPSAAPAKHLRWEPTTSVAHVTRLSEGVRGAVVDTRSVSGTSEVNLCKGVNNNSIIGPAESITINKSVRGKENNCSNTIGIKDDKSVGNSSVNEVHQKVSLENGGHDDSGQLRPVVGSLQESNLASDNCDLAPIRPPPRSKHTRIASKSVNCAKLEPKQTCYSKGISSNDSLTVSSSPSKSKVASYTKSTKSLLTSSKPSFVTSDKIAASHSRYIPVTKALVSTTKHLSLSISSVSSLKLSNNIKQSFSSFSSTATTNSLSSCKSIVSSKPSIILPYNHSATTSHTTTSKLKPSLSSQFISLKQSKMSATGTEVSSLLGKALGDFNASEGVCLDVKESNTADTLEDVNTDGDTLQEHKGNDNKETDCEVIKETDVITGSGDLIENLDIPSELKNAEEKNDDNDEAFNDCDSSSSASDTDDEKHVSRQYDVNRTSSTSDIDTIHEIDVIEDKAAVEICELNNENILKTETSNVNTCENSSNNNLVCNSNSDSVVDNNAKIDTVNNIVLCKYSDDTTKNTSHNEEDISEHPGAMEMSTNNDDTQMSVKMLDKHVLTDHDDTLISEAATITHDNEISDDSINTSQVIESPALGANINNTQSPTNLSNAKDIDEADIRSINLASVDSEDEDNFACIDMSKDDDSDDSDNDTCSISPPSTSPPPPPSNDSSAHLSGEEGEEEMEVAPKLPTCPPPVTTTTSEIAEIISTGTAQDIETNSDSGEEVCANNITKTDTLNRIIDQCNISGVAEDIADPRKSGTGSTLVEQQQQEQLHGSSSCSIGNKQVASVVNDPSLRERAVLFPDASCDNIVCNSDIVNTSVISADIKNHIIESYSEECISETKCEVEEKVEIGCNDKSGHLRAGESIKGNVREHEEISSGIGDHFSNQLLNVADENNDSQLLATKQESIQPPKRTKKRSSSSEVLSSSSDIDRSDASDSADTIIERSRSDNSLRRLVVHQRKNKRNSLSNSPDFDQKSRDSDGPSSADSVLQGGDSESQFSDNSEEGNLVSIVSVGGEDKPARLTQGRIYIRSDSTDSDVQIKPTCIVVTGGSSGAESSEDCDLDATSDQSSMKKSILNNKFTEGNDVTILEVGSNVPDEHVMSVQVTSPDSSRCTSPARHGNNISEQDIVSSNRERQQFRRSPEPSSGLANYFTLTLGFDSPHTPRRLNKTPEVLRRTRTPERTLEDLNSKHSPALSPALSPTLTPSPIITPTPEGDPAHQDKSLEINYDGEYNANADSEHEHKEDNFSSMEDGQLYSGEEFDDRDHDDNEYDDIDDEEYFNDEDFEDDDDYDFEEPEEGIKSCTKPPFDFTLHTILEESCEESDYDRRQKDDETSNDDPSGLEKYFFFGLGNGNAESKRIINEESEYSDSFSESSSSIISESLESNDMRENNIDPADLASSRLEKYFLTGLGAGFERQPSIRSMGEDSELHTDESGSVGSDSEGSPSPEQPRKKLLRPRGFRLGMASRSHGYSSDRGENPSDGSHHSGEDGDGERNFISGEDDGSTESEEIAFDKVDGQFDTIKRRKKKKNSGDMSDRRSDSEKSEIRTLDVDSKDDMKLSEKFRAASEHDPSKRFLDGCKDSKEKDIFNNPNCGDLSERKYQSRDSGFIGSSDDLLKDKPDDAKSNSRDKSSSDSSIDKVCNIVTGKESKFNKRDHDMHNSTILEKLDNDGNNNKSEAEERGLDTGGGSGIGGGGGGGGGKVSRSSTGSSADLPPFSKDRIKISRKDSFNWSSDEETNIMMNRMRAFFRNMLMKARENVKEKSTVKSPQMLLFEAKLTSLMKKVPDINDEQVKEIVEYLSSEETWSDSYDSSDYTASDLEGTYALFEHNPQATELREQISASCQQIIQKFDQSREPSDTDSAHSLFGGRAYSESSEDVSPNGKDSSTMFMYQRLLSTLGHMKPDSDRISIGSGSQGASPPLLAKVFHHIGTSLVELMHEVSGGSETGDDIDSLSGRYNKTPKAPLFSYPDTSFESDGSPTDTEQSPESGTGTPKLSRRKALSIISERSSAEDFTSLESQRTVFASHDSPRHYTRPDSYLAPQSSVSQRSLEERGITSIQYYVTEGSGNEPEVWQTVTIDEDKFDSREHVSVPKSRKASKKSDPRKARSHLSLEKIHNEDVKTNTGERSESLGDLFDRFRTSEFSTTSSYEQLDSDSTLKASDSLDRHIGSSSSNIRLNASSRGSLTTSSRGSLATSSRGSLQGSSGPEDEEEKKIKKLSFFRYAKRSSMPDTKNSDRVSPEVRSTTLPRSTPAQLLPTATLPRTLPSSSGVYRASPSYSYASSSAHSTIDSRGGSSSSTPSVGSSAGGVPRSARYHAPGYRPPHTSKRNMSSTSARKGFRNWTNNGEYKI